MSEANTQVDGHAVISSNPADETMTSAYDTAIPKSQPSATAANSRHILFSSTLSPQKPETMVRIEPAIRPWTPIPLRPWYAISLLCFMVLVAMALEIALHFSRVKNGWRVPNEFAATSGILHYVYTLPPVAVAMIIVALWAWTDVDIKKIQPYIDLAYGNAPASRTILLDYTTKHAAIVSVSAYRHRHYIVAASSLMVLTGLAIQPLAASLFTVKQVWWNRPNLNVANLQSLGLNPNFGNLTAFSTAAGFVQANVLYNATPPSFVRDIWAIGQVEVPSNQVPNGTMFANTTGIRSLGHCKAGDSSSLSSSGTGFTMSGTSEGCSVSISAQANVSLQYGVDIVTCPSSPPPDPFKPVVFWTFTQSSQSATPTFSLVYCTPTIELFNTEVQVALQTGELQNATIAANFTQSTNLTDPNGLMQGRAMNGVAFASSNADSFTQQRGDVAKIGLVEAIVQKAQMSPGGLSNQTQSLGIIGITENIYHLYLSLVATENYFVPGTGSMDVSIKTFQPRLFIVDATAHILTGVLFAFTILGSAIHVLHYRMRDVVVLPRSPGTLASAAAFTARSNVGDVLDGNFDERTMTRVLKDKRFKIDKMTGRIVMEGDEGYNTGTPLLSHPPKL